MKRENVSHKQELWIEIFQIKCQVLNWHGHDFSLIKIFDKGCHCLSMWPSLCKPVEFEPLQSYRGNTCEKKEGGNE